MGDILIRDMPEGLKRDVQHSARRAGRSVSDELKRLIRRGLAAETATPQQDAVSIYHQMRNVFSGVQLDDADHDRLIEAVETGRRAGLEREPPDFA